MDQQMQAVVLEGVNQPFLVKPVPVPVPGPDEVLVRVLAAALNHRDLWIQKGQYAGLRFPSVQGSDGCGVVTAAGSLSHANWIGKEVIINPSLNWGNDPGTQGRDYRILGMAADGTFAEYVCVPARLVHAKPAHLSAEEAAAFPLAGLTGFRTLFTRARAKEGETVLVTGVGGGVAMLAMQFAIAAGCKVFVTSGDDEKIRRAMELGAIGGVNYRTEGWGKELQKMAGGFHAIVDSACGDGFPALVDMAKPAGRIAFYGATRGEFRSGVPAKIFWKQLDILGSTMGTDEEFAEMVSFIGKHQVKPVVDSVWPLEDISKAAEKMETGKQFGKIVLRIASR